MTVRIGIIGTGRICRNSYLPALAEIEDVELSYFNRTRSKAEDCAREFGGRVADSVADLTADDPDAVMILTLESQRYAAAMEALEQKPRRIFFEKPLVAEIDQLHVSEEDFFRGREVLARAAEVGAETAMIFNYRFFDQMIRMRRLIEDRGLGRPVHAAAAVHYACWSHCIDLLLGFTGPVQTMTALNGNTERNWGDRLAADTLAAFTCEGGASGTIMGTNGMSFTHPLFELQLGLENGRMHFRDLDGRLEILDYRTEIHETIDFTRNTSRNDKMSQSFGKSLRAYVQSIRDSAPPPVPGLAGLAELQVEAAMRRSAREGRPVDMTEEFSLDLNA